MRHLGTQILKTDRLILRPLTTEDAIPMFENWASDPAVTRFLRWEPHKDWLETAQLLAGWECLYQNPDYYQWGVRLRDSNVPFGSISVMESEEQSPSAWLTAGTGRDNRIWEVGYCYGRAFWGKGYATEALCAVRDFWFSQVGGPWLACSHAQQNPASGRVMEKAGWQYDHDSVHHKFDGTAVDCRCYVNRNPNLQQEKRSSYE